MYDSSMFRQVHNSGKGLCLLLDRRVLTPREILAWIGRLDHPVIAGEVRQIRDAEEAHQIRDAEE